MGTGSVGASYCRTSSASATAGSSCAIPVALLKASGYGWGCAPSAGWGGGSRKIDIREVVNGVMYVVGLGCHWRALSTDLPMLRKLSNSKAQASGRPQVMTIEWINMSW